MPKQSFETNQPPAPLEHQPPQTETQPPETTEKKQTPQKEHEPKREQKETLQTTKEEGFLDDAITNLRKTLRRPKNKKKKGIIPQVRDELTVEIEHIMEEGLKDAFVSLTPVQQQEFKIKGEQTALQIRALMQSTKIKVKKIVNLLIDWLKLLPGINKFFLEQEAKIKADKMMAVRTYFDNKHKH